MDLTRSITSSTKSATDNASCRKLAFSVENILDPTKFCSRTDNKYSNNERRHWPNGYDRGDDRLDDEQSESQSGKFLIIFFLFQCVGTYYAQMKGYCKFVLCLSLKLEYKIYSLRDLKRD